MTPETDLILERTLTAPPAAIWRAWTEAPLLVQWFTPAPVRTTAAVIEPHPGGRFHTVMQLPDGKEVSSEGCILAAEAHRRLVFTDALTAGWRPGSQPFMTAIITMEPDGPGTAYRARVLHFDRAARERHEAMGFHDGWGQATDQLDRLAVTLGGG